MLVHRVYSTVQLCVPYVNSKKDLNVIDVTISEALHQHLNLASV